MAILQLSWQISLIFLSAFMVSSMHIGGKQLWLIAFALNNAVRLCLFKNGQKYGP